MRILSAPAQMIAGAVAMKRLYMDSLINGAHIAGRRDMPYRTRFLCHRFIRQGKLLPEIAVSIGFHNSHGAGAKQMD